MNPFNLLNALLFQMGWFACVLGGAGGEALWGFVFVGAMLGLAQRKQEIRSDLVLLGTCLVAGFALDSLWIRSGLLEYRTETYAPVWVLALWMSVALTINHSLGWLRGRPVLGGLLAGISAPVTYLAGERLGAVAVPEPSLLVLVALAWALLFTALFALAGKLSARALGAPVRADARERTAI